MLNVFIMNTVQSLAVILALLGVFRWNRHPTTGEPPLGVSGYACSIIGHDICYFGGWCGHEYCYHNSLNTLNVDDFTWKELFPTSITFGPMRKSDPGMLTFDNRLLVVGGAKISFQEDPLPSASCEESDGWIYTNEHHFYDREEG